MLSVLCFLIHRYHIATHLQLITASIDLHRSRMTALSTPDHGAFMYFDSKVALVVALAAIVVYTFKQNNDFAEQQ